MIVISTHCNITDLLLNLGFDDICELIDQPVGHKHSFSEIKISEDQKRRKLDKIILDVHKALMNINSSNMTQFKNVVDLLEKHIDQ